LASAAILVVAVITGVFTTTSLAFAYHSETNTEQSVNQENLGSDALPSSPVEETILATLLPAER